jgi:hypothetical protein
MKAGLNGLIVGKWPSTLAFIVLAPLIGLALGYMLMIAVYWIFHRFTPGRLDRFFRHAQIFSASLLSCAHGTNDAQKTMGIITARPERPYLYWWRRGSVCPSRQLTRSPVRLQRLVQFNECARCDGTWPAIL